MKPETIIALIVGTAAMFGIMAYCRKWVHRIPLWKIAVISVSLTLAGTAGAVLLFFIENGKFGGISFYGSILLIPLLFIPIAWIIRVPYSDLMDLGAPSVSMMLAIHKVNCVWSGCCKGRVLGTHADGTVLRFPSQIVELIVALVITALLIWLISKEKYRKMLYPLFFVIYGVTRFGLNWLRETKPFLFGLPAGNFWSLVAIVIGILWIAAIVLLRKKHAANN